MFAYRSTVSAYSTHYTPYELMFGREPRLVLDNEINPSNVKKGTSADAYVENLLPKIKIMNEVAKQNIEDSQKVYKEKYDRTAKPSEFLEGQLVWLHIPQVKPGTCKKMHVKYSGPYYIVEKTSPQNYLINDCKSHKQVGHAVHADRLKACNMDRDIFLQEMRENESSPNVSGAEELETHPLEAGIAGDESVKDITEETDVITKEREEDGIDNPSQKEEDVCNTSTGNVEPETEDNTVEVSTNTASTHDHRQWFAAKQLIGTKVERGQRYYKVEWEHPNDPPSWQLADDISEFLIQKYHSKYNMQGRVRKGKRGRLNSV